MENSILQEQSSSQTQLATQPFDLVTLLSQKVMGRSAATKAIVPYVYMYQSGLAPSGRPAGVFLLPGPTGTGKTKTVAAIAELLLMATNYANEKLTTAIKNHLLRVDAIPPIVDVSKLAGDLAQVSLAELNTAGLDREKNEKLIRTSVFKAKG